MEIIEIRDLDGPNLFLLQPAIKLEIAAGVDGPVAAEQATQAFLLNEPPLTPTVVPVSTYRLFSLLTETVNVIHDRIGEPRPDITTRLMESPGHVVIAFGWRHRTLGMGIARTAFDLVSGQPIDLDAALQSLETIAGASTDPDLEPELMRDSERRIPIVGITGTNGKTTTTRLLSSILMHSGKRVAWTSSAGVVVQGEVVLPGDYTGPAGAARVFEEPDLDVGVLETARGGILLRGLGYESNDVSIVTNVSADHLGLQGVHTVQELARVKMVVPAVTKPDGMVVLNACDDLVLAMRDEVRAPVFLISRVPDHPAVLAHREAGGWALWVDHGQVHFSHGGTDEVLTSLNEIPITFGGKALHMLENALCGAAGALALGLGVDQVAHGLASFRNEVGQNRGRLNVFDVNGVTVIVDFAHNTAGLKHLLNLGRAMVQENGRLLAVIGSAGDRPDDALKELGQIAATSADLVIGKDTVKYLRGRETGEIPALITAGAREAGLADLEILPREFSAYRAALDRAAKGDAIAIMCIEDIDDILNDLAEIGTSVS